MITAVILIKNEEENIKKCLSGLFWCDEVLVIDDNSTDETITQISDFKNQNQNINLKIYKRQLNGDFAKQRNYGLEKAIGDWVLFVDADERVSKELEKEILEKIGESKGIEGYYFRRIDYFMGKWLKHGETGSLNILRLGRKNSGKWVRNVDEVWEVKGQTEVLSNPLLHYSHLNLTQFLESINSRSTLNAQYLFENNENLNLFEWSKPFLKFIQNYFFKRGFLDGMQGFVFAVLMSLHSFMVRGKLYLLLKKK